MINTPEVCTAVLLLVFYAVWLNHFLDFLQPTIVCTFLLLWLLKFETILCYFVKVLFAIIQVACVKSKP